VDVRTNRGTSPQPLESVGLHSLTVQAQDSDGFSNVVGEPVTIKAGIKAAQVWHEQWKQPTRVCVGPKREVKWSS
jgi:hypothetical protein